MTEAQRITAALRGHWHRRYGVANCPAHQNTRTPALSLSDAPDGRLLLRCHAGCDFMAILDALRGLGVIAGQGSTPRTDPAEMARRQAEERAEAMRKAEQARRLWGESKPIGSTIAATYLREARGITCALPEALRFHPEAWHGPSARRLPAIIARVDGVPHFAVHRTYLREGDSGKADVTPAKMMLGNTKGGAVRVANGHEGLAVAEGVETALSLLCGPLSGAVSVWAALSASGIAGLTLPSAAGRLIIATDGDTAGRTAGSTLATRATALGWSVTMFPAPDGRDWNDIIRDTKGAAA